MEKGLRAFFKRSDWPAVLDCAEFQIEAESSDDIFRIPRFKDGGVWTNAGKNLGNHLGRFERALIILDEDFDPWPGAATIRTDIENEMLEAGWPRESFEAIVIQPMMESWLWTDNDSVAKAFGIANFAPLRNQFIAEGLWGFGQWKPKADKMKEVTARAMAAGWRLMKDVLFTTVFSELKKDAVDQCIEPGFVLFRQTLQRWFPKEPPIEERAA
jgi:hypothetical protein